MTEALLGGGGGWKFIVLASKPNKVSCINSCAARRDGRKIGASSAHVLAIFQVSALSWAERRDVTGRERSGLNGSTGCYASPPRGAGPSGGAVKRRDDGISGDESEDVDTRTPLTRRRRAL